MIRELNKVVYLCRECHDKLESLIPFRLQPPEMYLQIVADFFEEEVSIDDLLLVEEYRTVIKEYVTV